jgi:O-Antigen ligase
MSIGHQTLLVAHVLFWLFAVGTAALPVRWSIVSYLLLVQFDLTGSAFYSSEFVGWENAVKIVLVPTLLFLRLKPIKLGDSVVAKLARVWLCFAVYAAIAVLWSPYRLSGVKMLGYLYAYSVLFLVFTAVWRTGWLTAGSLMLVLWASLLFAVIQTYALGNDYGSFSANVNGAMDFEWRFTTFTGAQSFAAFLLCFFVLLLFRERWNFSVILSSLAAIGGIVLTGSRSIFLGLAWVLLLGSVILAKRSGKPLNLGQIAKRMALSAALLLAVAAVVLHELPENRLNQMLSAAVTSDNSLQDVGTFVWRFTLYQKTLDELTHRSPKTLLVGTGTSSAADLVVETGFFNASNVDPNRALHDEFLRSTYEWGIIGLLLLLWFLFYAISISIRLIQRYESKEAWAFLAIAVPLLISLAIENFLADSASPGGVAYNLLLTSMLAARSGYAEVKVRQPFPVFDALGWRTANPPGAWNAS